MPKSSLPFQQQAYILNAIPLQPVEEFGRIVKIQHKNVSQIGLTPVSTASQKYMLDVLQGEFFYVPRR